MFCYMLDDKWFSYGFIFIFINRQFVNEGLQLSVGIDVIINTTIHCRFTLRGKVLVCCLNSPYKAQDKVVTVACTVLSTKYRSTR